MDALKTSNDDSPGMVSRERHRFPSYHRFPWSCAHNLLFFYQKKQRCCSMTTHLKLQTWKIIQHWCIWCPTRILDLFVWWLEKSQKYPNGGLTVTNTMEESMNNHRKNKSKEHFNKTNSLLPLVGSGIPNIHGSSSRPATACSVDWTFRAQRRGRSQYTCPICSLGDGICIFHVSGSLKGLVKGFPTIVLYNPRDPRMVYLPTLIHEIKHPR